LDEDGETPPPAEDVEFEEDQVPPAPEEIGAATLSADAVASETVEDQGEGLPPIEPTVTTPVEPTVQTPAAEQQAQMERGFRVQIFAGGGRGDADQVAIQARTRTQDPVYVQFESPYYKVRVGDFQDRAKALEMRDRLRGYGYPQAWVVTTQVNVAASGP